MRRAGVVMLLAAAVLVLAHAVQGRTFPAARSTSCPGPPCADYNGDGFADLAIGVPYEDGAAFDDGAVNVIYGSASGLQASAPADQFWTQDSPDVEGVGEMNDLFGYALASGDFNSDGYSDLAIGVPDDGEIAADQGAVNVLYGSASGLQATAPADQLWTQDSSDVEDVAEAYDFFGSSLAARDFNADGFDDLAIGVLEEDEAATDQGAVNLLYGSSTGLQATAPADQLWTQDSPDVEDVGEAGDFLGFGLTAGDFNFDGYADLAIGAGGEDETVGQQGAVNVLYGSATGLQATAPPDQLWSQDSPNVNDVGEYADLFGEVLTSGDFNGDLYSDLAVGVSSEDARWTEQGAVNVLYGSSRGLQATSPPDQFWTQDSPGVNDTGEEGDRFGDALAAGDFNGDLNDDLAIGVPRESLTTLAEGAVNVLYGSSRNGLQTTAPADQFWTQNSPSVKDGAESGDFFGQSLAVGGYDAGFEHDLAIGTPGENNKNDVADTGIVQVLYGSPTGLQATSPDDQLWSQDSPLVEDTAEDSDLFGSTLCSGIGMGGK